MLTCLVPKSFRLWLRAALAIGLTAYTSLAFALGHPGNRHVLPKQAAIFGSVATWTYVLFTGRSITNCSPKGLNLRAEYGEDAELSISSLGGYTHECLLRESSNWKLSYTPMVNLTYWSGDDTSDFARSSYDIAFIPMIRVEPKWSWLPLPIDIEVGVGPSLMEKTSIGDRVKTTNFQFSDHFGIGVSGKDRSWRAAFAFRHLSNSNLATPNNGVNFFGVSVEMKLD